MAGCDPLEPDPLAIEIDPGGSGIPPHEAIVEPKGQPTEVVAPDEVDPVVTSNVEHDLRYRVVSEIVQRCEMGEVGLVHVSRR